MKFFGDWETAGLQVIAVIVKKKKKKSKPMPPLLACRRLTLIPSITTEQKPFIIKYKFSTSLPVL